MLGIHGLFQPKPTLTDEDVAHGLRMMTWEGVASAAMFSVTTNGLLVGLALALGASNLQIGILAAIPFLAQLVQVPAVLLVERFRRRKATALLTWAPAQVSWLLMALIPFFIDIPNQAAVIILLLLLAARGVLSAITTCSWNSWIRDLVPQTILGSFFSRRMALSTSAAIVFALLGAFLVDVWQDRTTGADQVLGYSWVLLAGVLIFGVASPYFMSRMPEPLMSVPTGPKISLLESLKIPLRDRNFRQLINFLFFWGFAVNLAVPFFTVFMLLRLEFSLGAVVALNVAAQIVAVLFLRVWGPLVDRFGSKVVLSLSASLYVLVILGWVFTTLPEKYFFTLPLVIILQLLIGAAAAGVNLTVGTIGLKLAPQNQSTAYMTAASLATNLGAGTAPLLGGFLADFFSVREFSITFEWISPARVLEFSPVNVTGFDFLFAMGFVVGLIALNTLTTIREEGEAGRETVLEELLAPSREVTRVLSLVPGMRFVSGLPYSYVRRIPGMDVAVGVTAYQLASSTRSAVTAVGRTGAAANNIAGRVRRSVSQVLEGTGDLGENSFEFARHASRGAMHALDDVAEDVGDLAHGAVLGIFGGLRRGKVDPADAVRGASYGAVQGAGEADGVIDVGEAAAQAIEVSREAAAELGLPPEEAAMEAALGAVAAAEDLGPDAVAQVREAIEREGLHIGTDLPERGDEVRRN